MQARRGELVDVLSGAGLLAVDEVGAAGVVTWVLAVDGTTAEIRAVAVAGRARRGGIARSLLRAAHDELRRGGTQSAWLITTNDNAGAIALYEGLGYELRELRRGAIDDLRRTIKPSIPDYGEGGVRISDELEYALDL